MQADARGRPGGAPVRRPTTNTSGTEFFSILIRRANGYPAMAWTPQDRVRDLGQHRGWCWSNSPTNGVLLDY